MSEPFCILGSKGRFASAYQGKAYLPALEEDDKQIEIQQVDMEWTARQWHKIAELQGEIKHVHAQIHEFMAVKKRRDRI